MTALTIPSLSLPEMTPRQLDTMHAYEAALLERPQADIPTAHLIHAGMYARTIMIPAGVEISGALMRIATVLVVSGHARVNTGNDVVTLKGYGVLPGSAGRKQAFLALEDTTLTMVFPTRSQAVAEAEAEFTDQHELLLSRTQPHLQTITITGE